MIYEVSQFGDFRYVKSRREPVTHVCTGCARPGAQVVYGPFAALRARAGMRICASNPIREGAMTNPFQFLQQTRAEIAKVVWPSRREVLVTTAMVFLMAVVFAIFFFFVDWLIRQGLEAILTIFG
jgi:preprotein translocase subunit SecE